MASMIVSSVISAMTSRLPGLPGRFDQRERGLFGSASITVTEAPFPASSVARRIADVDLPTPPFGLAKMIVGMKRCAAKKELALDHMIPDSLLILNGQAFRIG